MVLFANRTISSAIVGNNDGWILTVFGLAEESLNFRTVTKKYRNIKRQVRSLKKSIKL